MYRANRPSQTGAAAERRFVAACRQCGAKNRIPASRIDARATCGRCRARIAVDSPIAVTDADFTQLVENASVPVLVDYWAPWCGPCKMIAPSLESLARERAGSLRVAKLEVDHNPVTARRRNIRSVPALELWYGGRVIGQWVGVLPKAALLQRVDDALRRAA